MNLEIIKATIEQKPILANLLELYAYDFTEFCDFDIRDDGSYGYEHLPLYWSEENRLPFIIYVDNKIAGFILLQKTSAYSDQTTVWDITEFFIMKKYKRLGIGTIAATKIWTQLKGPWQIRVLVDNNIACSFWQKTIADFTCNKAKKMKVTINREKWYIHSLESK
jgi:predicted acetyltransferase